MGVFPVRVVFTFDAFGLPFYRIHHFQRHWEQSPHLCILFTEIVFHVSHRFSSTVYIPSLDPKMYLSLSIFKDNVQRLDDRWQKQDSAFLVLIQSLLHPSGKEGSLFFPYVQVPIPNDLIPCQASAFSSVLSKQITVPCPLRAAEAIQAGYPPPHWTCIPMPPCGRKVEVRTDLRSTAFKHSFPQSFLSSFLSGPAIFSSCSHTCPTIIRAWALDSEPCPSSQSLQQYVCGKEEPSNYYLLSDW